MAIDLFKAYGFQPKQYDQYMEALKKEQARTTKPKYQDINPIEKFQMILMCLCVSVLTTLMGMFLLHNFKLSK